MKWINTKDLLPDTDDYVLGIYGGGNWVSSYGNANVVVVRLMKGISIEERNKLKEQGDTRHLFYHFEDEEGNNLVPYAWSSFGPSSFFGQDITYWMPIPKLEI